MLLERSLADLQDNFVKVQLVTEHPLAVFASNTA